MGKTLRRMWRYIATALGVKFEERADPKIQIEQAIAEAQEQHKRLQETAAAVIGNQKKAEMDLERAMQELEHVNQTTQQAVLMAADAEAKGDTARAAELNHTAEAFANQLIAKEEDVESLKAMVLSAAETADQAKSAVKQNAVQLQKRLADRQKLLSQLDQAKMGEQMTAAMESMSATVGQDVPTLDEVRDKIEVRLAKAKGQQELHAESVEGRMLEVQQAVTANQAQGRLAEIRSRLGVAGATAPGEAAAAGGASAAGGAGGAAPGPAGGDAATDS